MRSPSLLRPRKAGLEPVCALAARFPGQLSRHRQSADRPLHQILAELEATFGVHAQCDSRLGRASTVVAAMVAECKPHLVVIGARGEHEGCQVGPCLGGTALKLLTRVEQPLLLVRETTADAYTRSLVAVDTAGTLSRRAVLWGSGLVQGGDCHVVHAYDVPYVERMRLSHVTEAVLDARMRQVHDAAQTTVKEVLAAAEGPARLHAHTVRGEPVAAVLVEITRHAPQLVILGKSQSQVPRVLHGLMGAVGFRITFQAPADMLVIS